MDNAQDVDRDFMSPKPVVQGTSRANSVHCEPMAEYGGTRDEADLARFGKQQQLNVRTLIPRYQDALIGDLPCGRETSASCLS